MLLRNLKNFVKKKEEYGGTSVFLLRKCANCGEEKPLNKDNYQVVKSFKSGFSYYCNLCDVYSNKKTNK
jgi:hypothetical protein